MYAPTSGRSKSRPPAYRPAITARFGGSSCASENARIPKYSVKPTIMKLCFVGRKLARLITFFDEHSPGYFLRQRKSANSLGNGAPGPPSFLWNYGALG